MRKTKTTRSTKRVGSSSQGYAPWTSKKRSSLTKNTYPDNWPELREAVLKRDNYTCVKCNCTREQAHEKGLQLHVDHIIRLADGGSNAKINLQTLCSSCHGKRLNHRHMRIR